MSETTTSEAPKKRVPLWAKILIGMAALIVILLIGARVFIGSSAGRGLIEQQIESRSFSGQTVMIDGLKGDLLSTSTIEKITLTDVDGVWAEIKQVKLSWKPFALIGRDLKVQDFTIGSIDISRQPVLSPSEPKADQASSSDIPLKAILVNKVEIGRFSLAKGVLPEAVFGSAKGNIDWTKTAADIDLDIKPGDQQGDLLALHVGWDNRTPLNGTFNLNGPAGGLFASLLQLEGQPVSASFQAEGTAKTATGSGELMIGENRWVTLDIRPENDGYLVSSVIALAAYPKTTNLVDKLGDAVSIQAQLDQSAKTKDPLKWVTVVTDTFSVDLSDIVLSGDKKSAAVSARLSNPSALLPADQIAMSAADFSGNVFVLDNGYSLQGKLSASGIERAEIEIPRLSGPVILSYIDGSIAKADLDLTTSKLSLQLSDRLSSLASAKIQASAQYDFEASQFTLSTLTLQTPKSSVNANAKLSLGEQLTIVSNGVSKIDLKELGLHEAGFVTSKWTVRQSRADRQTFTLNTSVKQLFADDDPAAAWLGANPSVSAKGELRSGETLILSDLKLSSPAFTLTGAGKANTAQELQFTAQLQTAEDYPLKDTLPGLGGTLSLKGKLERLALAANLRATKAGNGDAGLAAPEVIFDGLWHQKRLTGTTNVTGDLQEAPLSIASDISFADGIWSLANLLGTWHDIQLDGELSGNGGDLSTLNGDIALKGKLPDALPAGAVDVSARITGENVNAKGQLNNIASGPLSDGKLSFALNGTRKNMVFDLDLNGISTLADMPQKTTLSLKGTAMTDDAGHADITGDLSARIGANNFKTEAPLRFQSTANGMLANATLTGLNGKAEFALDETAATPLRLTLSDIGLASLMTMIGNAPVNGSTDMSLLMTRNGNEIVATLDGQLKDISVPQSTANPVSFQIKGEFNASGGSLNVRTPEGQMLQAIADINAPLSTLNQLPFLTYNAQKAGLITVKLDGPVDNMAAIFLPDRQVVRGIIKTDMRVPLPFAPNEMRGDVVFSEGVFQHENLGTDLEKINFNLNLAKGELSLNDFSANGRKGGTLKGAGNVGFAGALNSNFEIKADQLVVVNRKEAKAVASGTLGLDLTEKAIKIIGDMTLSEGLFRLDSLPSSSAPTLDVQFDTDEAEQASKAPLVSMDIAVKAPRSMKLVGKGMDAELSLDAKVSGTGSSPAITGKAAIVRGTFELLGKRFEFEDSEIEFRGDPMQARLNIVASRQTDDFLASVIISGTPEKPEISLTADPALPEDEVLSRVLFGRSPAQLTGLEAARLAAALASLSGGGGFDLMGGIENLTGFDNVDVGQNEDGEFQVATGRYLSDDVYMELSSGGSGAPGVSVEWEARDNVSVEAETKPDKGQKLSIQWKKDFD